MNTLIDTIISEAELHGELPSKRIGPCREPTFLPAPGKCARPSGAGALACDKGAWYRPREGDWLWSIARLALKRSGIKGISARAYMQQISNHPNNFIFRSNRGHRLATRQFLPRWGGRFLRTEVGRGGKYGLMFLPPADIDLGPAPTGSRMVVSEKVSCPR